jgi:hypothetical protein
MYCSNCGLEMDKNANYCPSCGALNKSMENSMNNAKIRSRTDTKKTISNLKIHGMLSVFLIFSIIIFSLRIIALYLMKTPSITTNIWYFDALNACLSIYGIFSCILVIMKRKLGFLHIVNTLWFLIIFEIGFLAIVIKVNGINILNQDIFLIYAKIFSIIIDVLCIIYFKKSNKINYYKLHFN